MIFDFCLEKERNRERREDVNKPSMLPENKKKKGKLRAIYKIYFIIILTNLARESLRNIINVQKNVSYIDNNRKQIVT